jgi:hypothetical protein
MKQIEENLDKLSRNKLASFLGMIGTSQSGDISSKLHDMAKKSGYQEKINKSTKGKYSSLTPELERMVKAALNKRKKD